MLTQFLTTVTIAVICSVLTWFGAETVSKTKIPTPRKIYMALVLGPALTTTAWAVGYLPTPELVVDDKYAISFPIVLGLVCSMGAKFFADTFGDQLVKKVQGLLGG